MLPAWIIEERLRRRKHEITPRDVERVLRLPVFYDPPRSPTRDEEAVAQSAAPCGVVDQDLSPCQLGETGGTAGSGRDVLTAGDDAAN